MILPMQTIASIEPVAPMVERAKFNGMTFGLGPAGYDVRIDQDVVIYPNNLQTIVANALHDLLPRLFKKRPTFLLASTMERFEIPNDVRAAVEDKSTWARLGLQAFNTNLEPGWTGWLTLELKNQSDSNIIRIAKGTPIAQIVFMRLEEPTVMPYAGKYHRQARGPVAAILER